MVIQHNLLSLTSGRQLKTNTKKTQRISEQLNSGYRINRAADDAAGLTISEKMRTQIRGLHQASDDLQDGVSYVQTADSALGEVQDMLHRMNELTIQSLNDTNTPEDRQAIDHEVQSLKTEIDRIFKTTEFNARKIWDAEANNPVPTGRVTKEPAVKSTVQLSSIDISNANKTYIPKRHSSSSSYGSYNLEVKDTGIIVTWEDCNKPSNFWTSDLIPWADTKISSAKNEEDWQGAHSFNLAEYLHNDSPNSNNGLTDAQFEELKAINNFKYEWNVHAKATKEEMLTAIKERKTVDSYTSTLEQIDDKESKLPKGVSLSTDIYYEALLRSGKDFDADDDPFIEATQTTNVVVNPALSGTDTDVWTIDFNMKNIGKVTATSTGISYHNNSYSEATRFDRKYSNGNYTDTYYPPNGYWWYYYSGSYKTYRSWSGNAGGSWAGIKNAMRNQTPNFEQNCSNESGTINVSFNIKDSSGTSIGTMTMYINVDAGEKLESVQERLAQLSHVDIWAKDSTLKNSSARVFTDSRSSSQQVIIPEMKYLYGLNIQSSDQSFDSIKLVYESMNLATLDLDTCSVDTRNNANETLEKAAKALNMVSDQRSLFGSYQNRMEHAMALVNNSEENAQASESRIRDTDMADAIQKLSVSQILSQASQAMLAQSNQSAQNVLQLLQ